MPEPTNDADEILAEREALEEREADLRERLAHVTHRLAESEATAGAFIGVSSYDEATADQAMAAGAAVQDDRREQAELMRQLDGVQRHLALLTEQLDQARLRTQEDRFHELQEEIARLAPLVESQREALGHTAAGELSADYVAQADGHAKAWKVWGVVFLLAVAGASVGGLLLFDEGSVPAGKLSNGAVVEIARNLVLIGLALYLVRLASLQFRVHRHLEAVSRSKATALSTFNRMTGIASEPEIRNSLAVVLAQAIFASEETGFVDASGSHVTLAESAVASALTKK